MLNLPKNFPVLNEPYLIVAMSIWVQLILMLFLFCISVSGIIWVLIFVDKLQVFHYFVLAISFLGLFAIFFKNVWERWIGFAANMNGVYVANKNRLLTFVPWGNVGETYVVSSENFGTLVVIKIKIDEYSWNKIPDEDSTIITQASIGGNNVDKDGYRHIEIGNYMQSARDTQRKIELLRQKYLNQN